MRSFGGRILEIVFVAAEEDSNAARPTVFTHPRLQFYLTRVLRSGAISRVMRKGDAPGNGRSLQPVGEHRAVLRLFKASLSVIRSGGVEAEELDVEIGRASCRE